MTDMMTAARIDAIREIRDAMLKAASAALLRHGDDPEDGALLLAAIAGFVRAIDKNRKPGFREMVVAALSPGDRTRPSTPHD